MAGLIVAGYDAVHKQGQVGHSKEINMEIDFLFSKVWCVPIGGMCVRQPMTIGGSGSSYLYGMMDHTYRVRDINMTGMS